jgi:hypothetical protein
MKVLTWAVIALMGAAMLVSLHQCVVVLMSSHGWKGLSPADWATWVQAFGATVGIFIAIWVPYKQRSDALRMDVARRNDESRRVRMAIKDELAALQRAFSGPNVVNLLATGPGEIFNRHIHIPAQRFPIYMAFLDRLTLIEDDALRTEIIGAYELAGVLIACGQENNRMLLEFDETQRDMQYNPDAFKISRQSFQIGELQKMCTQMRAFCVKAIAAVNAVVPKL